MGENSQVWHINACAWGFGEHSVGQVHLCQGSSTRTSMAQSFNNTGQRPCSHPRSYSPPLEVFGEEDLGSPCTSLAWPRLQRWQPGPQAGCDRLGLRGSHDSIAGLSPGTQQPAQQQPPGSSHSHMPLLLTVCWRNCRAFARGHIAAQ